MQSTDVPCSAERSALGSSRSSSSKESEGPSTRDRHAQGIRMRIRVRFRIRICGRVLDLPVVCVLVPRYYTISNRIKSLKVSITKRALQLPDGDGGDGYCGVKNKNKTSSRTNSHHYTAQWGDGAMGRWGDGAMW